MDRVLACEALQIDEPHMVVYNVRDWHFDSFERINTKHFTQCWELATLGDPLMDLGNTWAYWVEAGDDFMAQGTRRQPTHLPGMLTRKEVVAYYAEKTGTQIDDFTFYEVYGLFRLAAIVQQIYYRYHHKQTQNPAYKRFWIFVHYLLRRCKKAIKQQGETEMVC